MFVNKLEKNDGSIHRWYAHQKPPSWKPFKSFGDILHCIMKILNEAQAVKMNLWIQILKIPRAHCQSSVIEVNLDKIQALIKMWCLIKLKELWSFIGKVTALSRSESWAMDKCFPFFQVLKGGKKFKREKNANNHFKRWKST